MCAHQFLSNQNWTSSTLWSKKSKWKEDLNKLSQILRCRTSDAMVGIWTSKKKDVNSQWNAMRRVRPAAKLDNMLKNSDLILPWPTHSQIFQHNILQSTTKCDPLIHRYSNMTVCRVRTKCIFWVQEQILTFELKKWQSYWDHWTANTLLQSWQLSSPQNYNQ